MPQGLVVGWKEFVWRRCSHILTGKEPLKEVSEYFQGRIWKAGPCFFSWMWSYSGVIRGFSDFAKTVFWLIRRRQTLNAHVHTWYSLILQPHLADKIAVIISPLWTMRGGVQRNWAKHIGGTVVRLWEQSSGQDKVCSFMCVHGLEARKGGMRTGIKMS